MHTRSVVMAGLLLLAAALQGCAMYGGIEQPPVVVAAPPPPPAYPYYDPYYYPGPWGPSVGAVFDFRFGGHGGRQFNHAGHFGHGIRQHV